MAYKIDGNICKTICNPLGSCAKKCVTKAISIVHGGVAQINEKLCIECDNCIEACTYDAISKIPVEAHVH